MCQSTMPYTTGCICQKVLHVKHFSLSLSSGLEGKSQDMLHNAVKPEMTQSLEACSGCVSLSRDGS